MIEFGKLRFKNLMSYGNYVVEFDFSGIGKTLIVGENGAGKSAMLSGITYALFNRAFDGKTNPQLINSINNSGLWVELEWFNNGKNYKVVRGLKPNLFEIYMDNILIPKSDTTKYQEDLEKVYLGMNFNTFKQIVILGKSNYQAFMKLPGPKRREVIEELLDINVFSSMNEILKTRINKNSSDIVENKNQINIDEGKKSVILSHLKDLEQRSQNDIDEKRKELNILILDNEQRTKQIEIQNEQYTSISEKLKKLTKLEEVKTMLGKTLFKLESDLQVCYSNLSFYDKNDNCPTCKQEISKLFKNKTKEDIEKTSLELKEKEKELLDKVAKLDEHLNNKDETSKLLLQVANGRMENLSQIKNNEKRIEQIKKELEVKDNQKEKLQGGLDILSKNIDRLSKEKEELFNEKELYNVASFMLRDTGVKTKIIQNYIPIINKYINDYLAEMNIYVNFTLDENFKETIKSRYRDEFTYESFSEGQKARIDLAILFTWRKIAELRNSMSTNLIIFDEILDGSLDEEGTTDLMKILNMFNKMKIYIISHNNIMVDHFDNTIRVKIEDNFSVIE